MRKLIQAFNDWNFANKIGLAMALVGILPIAIGAIILTTSASQALQEEAFNELEAVASARVDMLDLWLREVREDVNALASLPSTTAAATEFIEYVEAEAAVRGDEAVFAEIRSLYLGQPDLLDAGDGGGYSDIHARSATFLNNYANARSYNDLMILAPDGHIVFNTKKEDDLGTNILENETIAPNLRLVFEEIIAINEPGRVMFEEFTLVDGVPEAYIGAGVFDESGTLVGMYIVEFPIGELTAIMNVTTGLGETGETYVVGENKLFHNDSRFLAELGVESTILNPDFTVDTVAVNSGLAGESGTQIVKDYRGTDVLSSWVPYEVQAPIPGIDPNGVQWVVLAEIDRQEIFAPIRAERTVAIILTVIASLAAAGLAFIFANLLNRQVEEITKLLGAVAVGNFDARAEVYSKDELGDTADTVNALLNLLTNLLSELEGIANTRLALLDNFDSFVGIGPLDGGPVLYINPAGMAMVGRENQSYNELTIANFHPADTMLEVETTYIPEMMRDGLYRTESYLQHTDGTRIDVDLTYVLITDSKGDPFAVGTIMRDIRDEKAAQRAQEDAFVEMNLIFNTAANSMRLIDHDLNTVRANEAYTELIGLNAMEAASLKCHEQLGSHICNTDQCTLKRVMNGERFIQQEIIKITPSGEEVPTIITAQPLMDAGGNILGVVEDFQDLRTQKDAEVRIRSQNEALQTALDDLRVVAQEVENAVHEVSNTSDSIQEVIALVSGQAVTSADVAGQAALTATEGERAVADTIDAMNRIRTNTQETAQRIKRLGEVTQEIGEATRLIEDLSDRTTVLALNASIQAAAAGEAGRGFAVVAEEVQRLAERATRATRQIEGLITSIRAEANEAMVSIEEVTREVVEGSTLAQDAGDQMTTLNALAEQLNSLIQHLSQTTSEQTAESLSTLTELTTSLRETVTGFQSEQAIAVENGHSGNGTQKLAQ